MSICFNDDRDHCDLEKVTEDVIYNLFPSTTYIHKGVNKYSVVDKEKPVEESELKLPPSGASMFFCTRENDAYLIETGNITIWTTNKVTKQLEDKLRDIWKKLPKVEEKSKEAIVNMVGYSNGDYYTIESKVKRVDINIKENYNDDFEPVYNDIVSFLKSRESGLVLLYGDPGSGKSSIIRHLCNHVPSDYIIVPTSLIPKLSDPDFITFMMDNADSTFILEDCEQLLMDRSINVFNGGISNILNMSDGLLSDVMNLKFICTFNADIKSIDSALLRKGRCFAKYEFKPLCEEKVKILNEKYNLGIQDIKPMTLAQIYYADKTEYSETKTKKRIGF